MASLPIRFEEGSVIRANLSVKLRKQWEHSIERVTLAGGAGSGEKSSILRDVIGRAARGEGGKVTRPPGKDRTCLERV